MRCILFFVGAILLKFSSAQTQTSCDPLTSPRYGSMMCTDGSSDRSRCTFMCDEDYQLSARSSENRRCYCREGRCAWDGVEPMCEYQAPSQADCTTPDFLTASYDVMDTWSNGAFLRISITSSEVITQGWSIALMFFRSLPEGFQIESGHVDHVATSDDRRIVTFNSKSHNGDISDVQLYDFVIFIKNVPDNTDPMAYSALIGFYNQLVDDAACIQVISPVRPLATTPSPPTPPTSPTTTQRNIRSTTSRTTTSATTTTRRASTRATTTTSSPPPPSSADCEVLDNPSQPGFVSLNSGWQQGNTWKFQGRFEHYFENRKVRDWMFHVEFPSPVQDIEIYQAESERQSNGRVWLITPKTWNVEADDKLTLNFIGSINGAQSGPSTAQVTFCQNGATPDSSSPSGNAGSSRTTSSTAAPTSSSAPLPAATASPQFLDNCRSGDQVSYGSLPASSAQTDPSRYTRSNAGSKYNYNQVLHMSILFYEAQRSGRLPSNNRIPWRGDAGLKDGCDVQKDLVGGFYDAGDNVKFGFPMAYTMTVLAWSMVEFQNAYENSGDWQAALDLLKWGTDYLIKAHTDKYELYVQVGNAPRDHGMWLRPEDIDYVQRSYKIDSENAGTEVAAETAAAMAAASLVFRSTDSQYADTLVSHAEELFEFADRYRRNYHESIPHVSEFYRSWSGYQDELLWGAIWLHLATNKSEHLNFVRDNYDNFGAGASPPEFSWDNKYAGVQVLMAQRTEQQKYINNVKAFYRTFDRIQKTPSGLTWYSQWGSNRYAANFAFISVMASKVVNLGNDRSKFVSYARSQIDYILGDNEQRRSYVVGMHATSPQRPHHRSSSCPAWTSTRNIRKCGFDSLNRDGPNPHTLYGAMVGGPNERGEYTDDRSDYISNEVAIDYNAGFQGAVAGLRSISLN